MSINLYFTFVAASAVLALLPGPNMALYLGNGAAYGMRAALLTVAGCAAGLAILAGGAALGMGSLMTIMSGWFDVVRWAGAAYLVWLGAGQLRAAFATEREDVAKAASSPRQGRWFFQGVVASLSNPKVLLFLGAFLPQFVAPGVPAGPQLALLAATFVVVLAAVDCLVALAAASARRWIAGNGRKVPEIAGGVLLLCGGVWLALTRN